MPGNRWGQTEATPPNIPFPLTQIQKKGMSCKKTRRGQKTKVPWHIRKSVVCRPHTIDIMYARARYTRVLAMPHRVKRLLPCRAYLFSKKVSENILHFLHPAWRTPIKPDDFGCRIGCRIFPLRSLSYTNSTVYAVFMMHFAWTDKESVMTSCNVS